MRHRVLLTRRGHSSLSHLELDPIVASSLECHVGMFAPINRSNEDWLLTFSSFCSPVSEISDQPFGDLGVPIWHGLAHGEEAEVREARPLRILVMVPVGWANDPFKKDGSGSTDRGAMYQSPGPDTCGRQKDPWG